MQENQFPVYFLKMIAYTVSILIVFACALSVVMGIYVGDISAFVLYLFVLLPCVVSISFFSSILISSVNGVIIFVAYKSRVQGSNLGIELMTLLTTICISGAVSYISWLLFADWMFEEPIVFAFLLTIITTIIIVCIHWATFPNYFARSPRKRKEKPT